LDDKNSFAILPSAHKHGVDDESIMDYKTIVAELEKGVDYSALEPMATVEEIKNRLIAMRQLAAIYEKEAQRLTHESEQLDNLLLAM